MIFIAMEMTRWLKGENTQRKIPSIKYMETTQKRIKVMRAKRKIVLVTELKGGIPE